MSDPLRVLLSFPPPRDVYNPYTIMLTAAIREQPGVTALNFSWQEALRGDFDVFHVHWPENLPNGNSPLKKLARQGLMTLFMARMKAKHIPVVRTVHNVGLPQGISRRETALIRAMDRMTSLFIVLNPFTPVPRDAAREAPVVVIAHGSMKPWFDRLRVPPAVPGRLAYAGRIRRYKGVAALLTAFRDLPRDDRDEFRLWIGGLPSTEEMKGELVALCGGDPRITIDFGFQPDEVVAERLGEAELVVLPYREMHNSAAALLALSLARPVLVPANEVNDALDAEVGPGWVFQFDGTLTADSLAEAVQAQRDAARTRPVEPDLSARGWSRTGADHVAAYRRAISRLKR